MVGRVAQRERSVVRLPGKTDHAKAASDDRRLSADQDGRAGRRVRHPGSERRAVPGRRSMQGPDHEPGMALQEGRGTVIRRAPSRRWGRLLAGGACSRWGCRRVPGGPPVRSGLPCAGEHVCPRERPIAGKIPRRGRYPALPPASRGLTPRTDYIFSKVT